MFCRNCGTVLPENAGFCANCGSPVSKDTPAVHTGTPDMQQTAPAAGGLVGFSNRIHEPEIIAAAKAKRKSSAGCMWILVLVPLVGFLAAGLLIEEYPLNEAIIIGVALALLMLIINLIVLARSKKPMWEGAVIDKYNRKKRKYYRSGDGSSETYKDYTEYTTVIRTDSGSKKTIVERDSERDMYSYLAIGDHVRFHPAFGTYEKYDKSRDRHIYCNVCRAKNPITNERCVKCNNLLFK
ncbi:MAG: zinc-ribbon domain-containing protein [Ruminococcaceae bacterium]|nr:zinc-ribbon domain-containing protein [Oscillospiraceae bacterium]